MNNIQADLSLHTVTASNLLEYLFCPRFIYFEQVLSIPQNEESRFKVQKGRTIHERFRAINPNYLRKRIGVKDKKTDLYLTSSLGIRGIIDEVLFLKDGSAAPLDYKFAEYKDKIFRTYKYQLVFYAQLIKENYDIEVNRGYLIYTRSKNKLIEVLIDKKDYQNLNKIVNDVLNIVQNCVYPKPTSVKKRCLDCCYKNVCEKTI